MKELSYNSGVMFDEATHAYTMHGKRLSGVTSLLHEVLHLGIYPDADEYVKQVSIPTAGRYGTCVHKAIEAWEESGLEACNYQQDTMTTRDYGSVTLPPLDVTRELRNYIAAKSGRSTLVWEYIVTDGRQFASAIDLVWDDADGVSLVDIKTNNLDAFPSGRSGFNEYVRWQLSIYAYMFEKQEGIKVKNIYCFWTHNYKSKGEVPSELVMLERVPDELVARLLNDTDVIDTPAGFVYEYKGEPLVASVPAAVTSDLQVPHDIVDTIAEFLTLEQKVKNDESQAARGDGKGGREQVGERPLHCHHRQAIDADELRRRRAQGRQPRDLPALPRHQRRGAIISNNIKK